MSEAPVSGARTQVPELLVDAGGRRVSRDELRGLGEVRVQQRLSMPTLCELGFFEPPGPLDLAADLTPGTTLWVGVRHADQASGNEGTLFEGEVTAVEHAYGPSGAREVRVRGYDRLHRLRQGQHLRTFARVTAAGLARQVAGEVGLRVQAAHDRIEWPILFQHHQSDLEFLVEICARCGLYLTLRGDVLHLIELSGLGPSLALTLGQNLLEARLELNSVLSRDEVTASGWDPLRATAQTRIEARTPSRAIGMAALPRKPGEGVTAHHLVNESTPDRDHARALAQADAEVRQSHEKTLWGIASGNPELRPGGPVEVSGVARSVSGRYVLTEVTHLINNQVGYVSEIGSAPPAPRPRVRGVTATVGVVVDVKDPGGRGRVKVRLPAYGDLETDWMGILTAGAGPKKGLVIPPDRGDTVLVLLPFQDPGQGIVLGGLYGIERVPDSGVNLLGRVQRYTWTTPDGQRIQLDDADESIHLENGAGLLGAGSQIDIKGGQIVIKNRAGSYIELDGDRIVIAGKAIDFRSR